MAGALPTGFGFLIAAQFCSALADNALLIVAIAWLVTLQWPAWWAPLLKFSFTIAYVVLAPWVGVWADRWPKAWVMMAMNGLKMLGVLLLMAQGHPLLALGIVGIGAAAYAPAKYGLVTELARPAQLVAANAWIEVSTVCAALLGAVLGGLLVSPAAVAMATHLLALLPLEVMPPGMTSLAVNLDARFALGVALSGLLALYGLAALLNLGIPDSGARYPQTPEPPAVWLRSFARANQVLWADRLGGLSLAVTTLFWGVAAVLQFAVLRWAMEVLHLGLDQAAYLQGVVALGIVAGASIAGRWARLERAARVLPLGVLLGLVTPAVALVGSWWSAIPLLLLVGALGGALVVPLNALLQHRGHVLLTAGRSIAVQNFNENLSVLAMLSAYAALLALDVDIRVLMAGLGLWVAVVVAGVWFKATGQVRRNRAASGP